MSKIINGIKVNLGLALRRKGYSVGLLDLDVYGPSFPLLLNMNHMPDLTEGMT